MRPRNVWKTKKKICFVSSMLAFIYLTLFSCANPLLPVDSDEAQLVKAELEDRSFRQFDPSKDANKRKAVILDFFDGVRLWAQYAEGNTALSEGRFFRTIIALRNQDRNIEFILMRRVRYKYSRRSVIIVLKLQGSPFRSGISLITRKYGSS